MEDIPDTGKIVSESICAVVPALGPLKEEIDCCTDATVTAFSQNKKVGAAVGCLLVVILVILYKFNIVNIL